MQHSVHAGVRGNRYRRPSTPHRTQDSNPLQESPGSMPALPPKAPSICLTGKPPANEPWRRSVSAHDLSARVQELSDRMEWLAHRLALFEQTFQQQRETAPDQLPPMLPGPNKAEGIFTTTDDLSQKVQEAAPVPRRHSSASKMRRVGSRLQRVLSRNRPHLQSPSCEVAELDGVEVGRTHPRASGNSSEACSRFGQQYLQRGHDTNEILSSVYPPARSSHHGPALTYSRADASGKKQTRGYASASGVDFVPSVY